MNANLCTNQKLVTILAEIKLDELLKKKRFTVNENDIKKPFNTIIYSSEKRKNG